MDIEICLASPLDAREIQEVLYRTWLATYPNEEIGITVDDIEDRFKNRSTEEKLATMREYYARPPRGETILVAKAESNVVGFCRVEIFAERNYLKAIYVLPEFQNKGIGKKMWHAATKYLKPEYWTLVSVATYSANAIEFYEILGFRDTGTRVSDEKRYLMKSGAIIPQMIMRLEPEQFPKPDAALLP